MPADARPAFDFQPHLAGDLVDLRPMQASDWDGLYAIGSDPLVWALHPDRGRYRDDAFRAYFEEGLACGGALTAVSRTDGALIGSSRYSTLYTQAGEVEIGWTFLGRAHWGGLYNADMKRLMLDHAFRFVDHVVFRVGEHNLRSRRAVEKIGAQLTTRSHTVTVAGQPSRHVFYLITRP
ncbi:GNAT family N-acetyltransferase [Phenylobacterium sp.]|uniref:GNAT family N-acetyltransferase n=1 Tax=Phenylobacterium sp. TaxID=1871053 RepID=UPI002735DF28|nr:GNAT family N-acetyltransferase [Phenylobacterium sp.]MDP3660002.1 GNAT family N-acetyltransferase [Phenylobacterium sp.]